MSPKECSLAVQEIKDSIHDHYVEMEFVPELKVLVNKRKIGSETADVAETVSISGRITVSF